MLITSTLAMPCKYLLQWLLAQSAVGFQADEPQLSKVIFTQIYNLNNIGKNRIHVVCSYAKLFTKY